MTTRRLMLLLTVLCLVGCGQTSEGLFALHVLRDAREVREIRYAKASCMGCPMYFRFEASESAISEIVSRHKMHEIKTPPEHMLQVVRLSQNDWWANEGTMQRTRKYWVEYRTRAGLMKGEAKFRLALVDKNVVYFATSGFFDRDSYEIEN